MDDTIKKLNKEVADFFGFEIVTADLHVNILNSRVEINNLLQRKTEKWLVGVTTKGKIYILAEDKFESESSHPKSHFYITLKHEIAHRYYSQFKKGGHPNWLNEGVALSVAGQNMKPPEKINLEVLKKYYRHSDEHIYGVGYFMVQNILHNYNKDKLFELIKLNSSKDLYFELNKMFKWLK